MNIIELLILSIGLSMDSFAVSTCKGMAMKKLSIKKALIMAAYFMGFHIIMILMGYLLGSTYERFITSIDHWIAFALLAMIGASMIKDAFDKNEKSYTNRVNFKTMLPLALATSVDALAVGISFAFLKANIIKSIIVICSTVFVFSLVGSKIGNKFGDKYEHKAQIAGGIILILVGVKILLEHLGVF